MRPIVPLSILAALFVLAPTLVVVPMSFGTSTSLAFPPSGYWLGYYAEYFTSPDWLRPTANSLIIAAASTVLTMAVATPAAYGIVRYGFAGRAAVNLFLLTPIMVPHIALALGYYSLFAPLRLIGTHLGVVLAHAALNIPVAFLIVAATLKGFDINLERAACNLGAGPIRAFFTVTMPVLRPGFVVAGLFSFVHSFDETTIALFISGLDARTLPTKMFQSIEMGADPVIAVVSTLLVGLACAGVLLPLLFRSRRTAVPERAGD